MDSYTHKSIVRCFKDNDSIFINYFIKVEEDMSPFEFLGNSSKMFWSHLFNEGRKYSIFSDNIIVLK